MNRIISDDLLAVGAGFAIVLTGMGAIIGAIYLLGAALWSYPSGDSGSINLAIALAVWLVGTPVAALVASLKRRYYLALLITAPALLLYSGLIALMLGRFG